MLRRDAAVLLGLACLLLSRETLAQRAPGKPRPPATKPAAPAPAPAPPSAAPPAQPANATAEDKDKSEARTRFERGLELLSEEAYDAAYVEFAASRKLFATKSATKNAAICLRRLHRYDEALEAFESLLHDFPNLTDHDRAFADKELASLRGLVGSIDVRGGEPGAQITIDGRDRGALPVAKALGVSAGARAVRVFKSGFAPFEARVDVAGGQSVVVPVRLQALARAGRLSVTEQSGKAVSVVVDNVVVGAAPWEGTISVGDHTVLLRGDGDLATQPASAKVSVDQLTQLALAVEPLTSTLRVEPTPVNALVAIDGISVGRGVWEGRLRTGAHKLEVVDEGFLPAARPVSVGAGARAVEQVGLERDMDSPLWRRSTPSRWLLEATVAGAVSPGYGGDIAGASGASAGPAFGGRARASLGLELGMGLGFAFDLGYAWTRQSVSARANTLSPLPVGSSPAENGTTDHDLTARGAVVGGSVFYHRGTKLRWTARLGGGLWLASVVDRRLGSFTTSVNVKPDGTIGAPAAYALDGTEQSVGAQYAYVAPEVRLGMPFGKGFEVSFGVEGFVAFALSQPRWDPLGSRVLTGTCRGAPTANCVTDGLAVFDNAALTGSAFLLLIPGVALRYEL